MAKNNAKCSICGQEYNVCITCAKTKTYAPWRTIVDSIEHYKIYIIIRDYTNKYIDKNKAKKLLLERDLSDLDTFVLEIKNIINEIMKEEIVDEIQLTSKPKRYKK